jgi:outer membrane protein OmpA-like peptidoglycan-associated protein
MTRLISSVIIMIVANSVGLFAQAASAPSSDDGYWVDHWSKAPVILFGSEEQDFYDNLQPILFPWNDHDDPSNPAVLDGDATWLKDHPSVHFYVNGFASSRGELVYNLALSQRRAEWVKQALISRGIPEERIRIAVGWGQLYPLCLELNDSCWSKNRLVRFQYSPN